MATTLDLSGLRRKASYIRRFADGDAVNYTLVLPPPMAKTVTVKNLGTGDLLVAMNGNGTDITGPAAAADENVFPVASGAAVTLALVGDGEIGGPFPFSVFGVDSAIHPMSFLFDSRRG